jgi:hypothetical protein
MLNNLKRWLDRNQGLHDASDTPDVEMIPPAGWQPVQVYDATEYIEEDQ